MKHCSVIFKPEGRRISIHAGATVLEAAEQAGIILNTVCGGKGICRKCLVIIDPDGQEVPACQHHIQNDLTVTIPPASRFFEQKILAEGLDIQAKIQPDVYKKYLKISSNGKVFGLAVDIGTTTVVAKLVDMTDGQCLATQADLNGQMKYGDDVISRIHYAETGEKSAELQKLIVDGLNNLTEKLCEQVCIEPEDIYEACVVGNTTMNHIFLKFPVTGLGQAPYKAFNLEARDHSPQTLGVRMNAAGNIHTAANIAGFVGADTTAVALATDVGSIDEQTLIVDIGTNGEIVLGTGDKLYAASCAAGPALEGARITCGSRAMTGAIEAVVVNEGDIDSDVIGGGPANSIRGSALIDAAAVLLDLGIVNATGRFVGPERLQGRLSPTILSRIIEYKGQPAFVLADDSSRGGQKVFLTQADIRQLQLAKAAIRAGIRLLQKKVGIEDSDIKQIFLAGAFGNYIRRESALRIGLLPDVPAERIHFVGNAAGSGAQMILLSRHWRKLAEELASRIEYVEIADEPEFQTVFAEEMRF